MSGLRSYLLKASGSLFVVLDGAQFADLPAQLLERGLSHRSLYRARGGAEHADYNRTAPQLVGLDQQATPGGRGTALDAALELLGDRPAAAFWACRAGEDALYRHLRGINMVLYPKEKTLGAVRSMATKRSMATNRRSLPSSVRTSAMSMWK